MLKSHTHNRVSKTRKKKLDKIRDSKVSTSIFSWFQTKKIGVFKFGTSISLQSFWQWALYFLLLSTHEPIVAPRRLEQR